MFSYLMSIYTDIIQASKENQMLAAAIGLWGLGVLTYITRTIPGKLWAVLHRQTTTSLVLNNAGYNGTREIFNQFCMWHRNNAQSNFSRAFSVVPHIEEDQWVPKLGPGYGLHVFFHKGRFYWFSKQKMDSAGSDLQKEEITIHTFGRSRSAFDSLMEKMKPERKQPGHVRVYNYSLSGCWESIATINPRSLTSVIMNKDTKNQLLKYVENFFSKREWLLSRGLPHKLTTILHGPPGTGKTSLIKALASEYNMDVFILNVSTLTDAILERALRSVPSNNIVLIDDFDSSKAFKSRGISQVARPKDEPRIGTGPAPISHDLSLLQDTLSLTGVLNALDGLVGLDQVMVFLNTNRLEGISSAVLRKGRTDLILELGLLGKEEILEYINYVYPDIDVESKAYLKTLKFKPTPGCDLQALLLSNEEHVQGFINDLVLTATE